MSDPTSNEPNQSFSEQNQSEYQPPPPPSFQENIEDQEPAPVMSEPATLASIFFEPSRVFESFRAKPRFLLGALIIIIAIMTYTILFYQKVGYENFIRSAMERSPQASQMNKEQVDQAVEMQSKPVFKAIGYAAIPVAFIIIFVIGALIYMLGVMVMGGKINFGQALGVWIYSWLPPILISKVLDIILLFVKSPDSYDLVVASRRGLVQANLGFLVSAKDSPVLHTLLASFDVFQFYGLFLAALGLRILGRISSGLAWTIVIGLWLFGVAIQILGASLFGGG